MARSVVVLNASYEPISRTKLGRAINLVVAGEAVIEEAVDGLLMRHQTGELPYPKIIRMLRYIKIPNFYEPQPWSKSGVIRRDNATCQYCRETGVRMTIDHVNPRALGGGNSWENTVAACFPCNNKKGHKTLKESGMVLIREPRVPLRSEFSISI